MQRGPRGLRLLTFKLKSHAAAYLPTKPVSQCQIQSQQRRDDQSSGYERRQVRIIQAGVGAPVGEVG